jgi:hypothetical protein
MGILDQIRAQVETMSVDQVREQLLKMQEKKAAQAAKRQGKGLTAEQLDKRKEYNRTRLAKPEVKAKMKEYRERPETKEKMKAARKRKQEKEKMILARAAELGITPETIAAERAASGSTEQPSA